VKRIQIVLLALALVTVSATLSSAGTATPRVDRREWKQRARIHQGVVNRSLTPHETHRLRAGERRIHAMEWRAKSDGYVSPRERAHLNMALDRESARIWHLKHNLRGGC
jgi:hypothetical protein